VPAIDRPPGEIWTTLAWREPWTPDETGATEGPEALAEPARGAIRAGAAAGPAPRICALAAKQARNMAASVTPRCAFLIIFPPA